MSMRRRILYYILPLVLILLCLGIAILSLMGCDRPRHRVFSEAIVAMPEYQRFSDPVRGAPALGLWDTGVSQLIGVRADILCPNPPLTGQSPLRHAARVILTGTWPLAFIPGDTLRGTLSHAELIEFGVYNPQPIPDSLGVITGGRFALASRPDTLSGYVILTHSGPCACEKQPVPILLVKDP